MFSFICTWTNDWVNNRDAGGLRRHRAHYDVTVMCFQGNRGSPGSPGSPGPRGEDGSENGSQGFTGSTGPRGGTGSTGPQGVRGPPGRDWLPPLPPTGGPGPNDIGNVAAHNMECASQEVLGKILPWLRSLLWWRHGMEMLPGLVLGESTGDWWIPLTKGQ